MKPGPDWPAGGLDRVYAGLAGTDADDFLHIGDEYLAVSDPSSLSRIADGFDDGIRILVRQDDFNLYLGQKVDDVFGTAIELGMTLLAAETLGLGDGVIKIEMHFLPDVYVTCDVCHGKRYNRETLDVHFKGKSIADVLDMTVEEGVEFFSAVPAVRDKLQSLFDVGLGYIKVGQQANTLSGGEAQRVKLAKELSKRSTGRTLYILDEPTTGLHFHDVAKLLEMLHELVNQGNSVVVIEHNLEVIKTADWIIDIGPEGGTGGGEIVAAGTPEQIVKEKRSYTGQFLKELLERRPAKIIDAKKAEAAE